MRDARAWLPRQADRAWRRRLRDDGRGRRRCAWIELFLLVRGRADTADALRGGLLLLAGQALDRSRANRIGSYSARGVARLIRLLGCGRTRATALWPKQSRDAAVARPVGLGMIACAASDCPSGRFGRLLLPRQGRTGLPHADRCVAEGPKFDACLSLYLHALG